MRACKPKRPRRERIGNRKDLADVYNRARELIEQHDLLRLKHYVEIDGVKTLTICNLWRIERHPDQSLRLFTFSLTSGEWNEVPNADEWPEIPFCPVRYCNGPGYWRDIVGLVGGVALTAAGLHALPNRSVELTPAQRSAVSAALCKLGYDESTTDRNAWNRLTDTWIPLSKYKRIKRSLLSAVGVTPEMRPIGIAAMLNRALVGWQKHENGRFQGGRGEETMAKGARALRAAFWEHIVDRDVVSAMMSIDWQRVPFRQYLAWDRHYRAGLLKVAYEHRNLLPLLPHIRHEHWSRDDLFSRNLWVRGSRANTEVERKDFAPVNCVPFQSFQSKAPWRWLLAAPSKVVASWIKDGGRDPALLTDLACACANIPSRVPVCALIAVIRSTIAFRHGGRADDGHAGDAEAMRRLFWLYLSRAAEVWKSEGFKRLREWMGSSEGSLSVMFDYLGAEGFAADMPDRNSTWASLRARSEDWHRRDRLAKVARLRSMHSWTSALPETTINGITFRPLVTTEQLIEEGDELHHCVGNYDRHCHQGVYRVFAVVDADGARSTLGIFISPDDGAVRLEQHFGACNSPVAAHAAKAAKQLVTQYRKALRA